MLREEALGRRMLEILLRGVSKRQYAEMSETAGVSRSSVGREAVEASELQLKELCERRFEDVKLLNLYPYGVIFGNHHVRGGDGPGPARARARKHVWRWPKEAGEKRGGGERTARKLDAARTKVDRTNPFV